MKKLGKVLSIGLLVLTVIMLSATHVKAATTVKLNKSSGSLEVGKTYTLTATVNGKKATKVTWKSSNTAIASISSAGKITAKKAGTATLTGTASGKSATCKLTVKKAPAPKLNVTSGSLQVGKTYTLKATVNSKAATGVTWKTSNATVATISSAGKITAKKAGSATLTATVNGSSATCKLTVKNAPAPKLNVTSGSLEVGKTYTLKATVNSKAATGVTWKTSNATVATISSAGKITAKKVGTATLTATVNGSSATCKLTVKKAPAPKLNVTSGSLQVGKTYTLKATVNNKAATGVTWKTSSATVATISSAGTITAKNVGTATLTATVNGSSAVCKLTVKAAPVTQVVTKSNSAMETKAKANAAIYNAFIQDVVKYTNQYRAKHGANPVTLDSSLTFIASYRSTEMAQKDVLSHTRPDGGKFYNLAKQYGITYHYIGENIGAYQRNAKEVVDQWYASPSHKANMLSKNYTKIGVGVGMTTDQYYYWTQIFKD